MFVSKPPPHLPESELARHPSWYRYTRKYRKKKQIVRDIWIVSGLLMINAPLGAVCALALLTTFIGLMILDETP